MFNYVNFEIDKDNIILKSLTMDPGSNKGSKKHNINTCEKKTLNNIIRSRSEVHRIARNNDFTYFLTATISNKYDRSNLHQFIENLTRIFRDIRKKFGDFFYIIIPELHKDLKNWHVHGLIGGDSIKSDLYLNKFNYLSLRSLDNLGFNSLSPIRDKKACDIYITKYITKTMFSIEKWGRSYYCSKNLNRGFCTDYKKINYSDLSENINFDYQNKYIATKEFKNNSHNIQAIKDFYSKKLNIKNLLAILN